MSGISFVFLSNALVLLLFVNYAQSFKQRFSSCRNSHIRHNGPLKLKGGSRDDPKKRVITSSDIYTLFSKGNTTVDMGRSVNIEDEDSIYDYDYEYDGEDDDANTNNDESIKDDKQRNSNEKYIVEGKRIEQTKTASSEANTVSLCMCIVPPYYNISV